MKQFKTVFKFEYTNYIRNKGFLAITGIIMVIIMVLCSLPAISGLFGSSDEDGETTKGEIKTAAVLDLGGLYSEDLLAAYMPQYEWVQLSSLTGVEDKITNGDYEIAVAIDGLNYTLYQKGSSLMFSNLEGVISEMVRNVYQLTTLAESGMSLEEASALLTVAPSGEVISIGKDITQSYWVSYFVIFLIYMVSMMYGNFTLSSVVTEKSSKAMELLITSAKPFKLLFGKVMGVGAAGLTQFALILLTAFACMKINYNEWLDFSPGVAAVMNMSVSSNLLGYAIIFFMLGFFSFSFVYAALGSTVSRMEDANSAVMLPMFIFMASFFVAIFGGMTGSDAFYIKVCSFVPFMSPMVMIARICVSDVAFWQVLASIGLNIAYIFGLAFLSSRIYKTGVMLYGTKPSFRTIIKYATMRKPS